MVVALLAAWQLAPVLLLAFVGALGAIFVHALSDPVAARLHLPRGLAAGLTILVLLVLAIVGGWFLGGRLGDELQQLGDTLPRVVHNLQQTVALPQPLDALWQQGLGQLQASATALIQRTAEAALGFGAAILFIAFFAIYTAINPGPYRRGLLWLLPPAWRAEAEIVLHDIVHGLRYWMLGQLVSMASVSVLIWIGLALLGIPQALGLALIAGAFELVPVLGPWLSAVPGVLIGLNAGTAAAVHVALMYLVVQQLESNVIVPLAERWAIRLPAGLVLFAIAAGGVLFGLLGVLLATPLTLVVVILVQDLWMQPHEGDNESTTGPGPI